ncbi:hypothetical protein H2200_012016 [Cladophialophora chaetospira]|uniref:Protein kinase domain-containing protein n=1 Tax=Cladophialophora chaetospira TaxID=386627 RepID=A0AA38WY01_9EURO|nr:hypothetical protein H2200_012016 [Cladophialophora chaetospira]
MSGVELGLAIVATVDLCFKYGNLLVELYTSFKAAESRLKEHIVRLETVWFRTTSQLQVLKSVWQSLNPTHQQIQNQIVDILAGKLKIAVSRIEGVIKKDANTPSEIPGRVRRWKYALLKEGLDKSLDEIETWQRIFDPSWFFIMQTAASVIDDELSAADQGSTSPAIASASSLRIALRPDSGDKAKVFLPLQGLNLDQSLDIAFSSLTLAQRKGSSKWLILEKVNRPAKSDPALFIKDVRDIARKLSHANPLTFGLLNCYGVIRLFDSGAAHPSSFTFVFRVPDGFSNPRTLRAVLQHDSIDHSLSERFEIAKGLARAVSYVHCFGFVHKNIRPETVLLLHDGNASLGHPFLVGFEAFRNADGRTLRLGDSTWNLNIYRHPHRQGEIPHDDYVMQHDIYSLGVCLLELGLFVSFVVYDEDSIPSCTSSVFGLPAEALKAAKAIDVKEHLVSLARAELPKRMGSKYTNVVVTCLTCLDEENIDFGDQSEFQDEDGILVGVRYIDKVC